MRPSSFFIDSLWHCPQGCLWRLSTRWTLSSSCSPGCWWHNKHYLRVSLSTVCYTRKPHARYGEVYRDPQSVSWPKVWLCSQCTLMLYEIAFVVDLVAWPQTHELMSIVVLNVGKQRNSCSRCFSYYFTCTNTTISVITITNSINILNSTVKASTRIYIVSCCYRVYLLL